MTILTIFGICVAIPLGLTVGVLLGIVVWSIATAIFN